MARRHLGFILGGMTEVLVPGCTKVGQRYPSDSDIFKLAKIVR